MMARETFHRDLLQGPGYLPLVRHRGLRWLHRYGHLDSLAVHTLDAPDHAGGWSVNASVTIPGWDRHGQERLDDQMLVYSLRKATVDGRTELYLTPLELLDRLARLITPPRIHKHRYCGVLAPNARLRRAVIQSAGPAGATLQVLQEAREKMGLQEVDPSDTGQAGAIRRTAARCWALLLARMWNRCAIPPSAMTAACGGAGRGAYGFAGTGAASGGNGL